MWITKIILQNIRSFENETIRLSKGINVLVGPNNSGKSTIAYTARLIQEGFTFDASYIRLGAKVGNVEIHLEGVEDYFESNQLAGDLIFTFSGAGKTSSKGAVKPQGREKISITPITPREPINFIYPYLSKRKVGGFEEQVNEERASAITDDFKYLYAKVDKVSNPEMPAYGSYVDACKKILGFVVTCSSSPQGKKACFIIDNFRKIALDNMGEGVANVLGLLVDLCIAENKLFVIEEPENDIHPKALKELLKVIVEKSENNQFIVTTHSNIVTRFLGAEPKAKIFKVDMELRKKIPTSDIEIIENNPEARQHLLEHLGYELVDLELWTGWLFLEESSAEKIIRKYLLPWFTPSLGGKLKTFSARSVDEVEAKFGDFNILFSYLNMQPAYKNRAWVIVDKGDKEEKIVQKLKEVYGGSGWSEDHFQQWDKHDFEGYYPKQFEEKVAQVLALADRKEKRAEKKALLGQLEAWIGSNLEEAKSAFAESAVEVIEKLKLIEGQL